MRNVLVLFLVSLVLVACGGGGGGGSSTSAFSITATISGYSGALELDNLGTTLNYPAVSPSGAFSIASNLTTPTDYDVTIPNPPSGYDCTVANGGPATATGNVSDIAVTCAMWSVTGTISGYVGDVGLKNNNGAPFNVTSNSTSYLSPTAITIDSNPGINGPYDVTVATTPLGYECTVANGSGSVDTGSVNNVVVHCANTNGVWENISGSADLGTARRSHTATMLTGADFGTILVVGGVEDGGPVLGSAELINSSNGRTNANSLNLPRYWHTSTLLNDGSVLVAGGISGGAILTAERYNEFGDNLWYNTANSMTSARYNHTATLLDDGSGKVLVVGGSSGGASLSSAEIFTPGTNTWATTTDIPNAFDSLYAARELQSATSLGDGFGKVLVAGGISNGTVINDTEIYDPNDPNIWSSAGTLTTERYKHTATRLPSGKILVVGGTSSPTGATALDSSEIYDPVTGLWSTTAGSLQTARYGHTATLRNDGTVLITGGTGPLVGGGIGPLATSELYDGITETWIGASSLKAMLDNRTDFTATLRTDGTVLVVGGTRRINNIPTSQSVPMQFRAN